MNSANVRRLVPLLLLISTTGNSEAVPDSSLVIVADTPTASIQPRQTNRKFIRLPSLEYVFEIRAHCLLNSNPTSLLLSVADTRKSLHATDISSGSPIEVALRIPAAQIGPIAVEDFCHIADEPVAGNNTTTDELTISAALSAHISLRCESESDQKVTYVSRPLDVNLICERPDQAQRDELLIDLD